MQRWSFSPLTERKDHMLQWPPPKKYQDMYYAIALGSKISSDIHLIKMKSTLMQKKFNWV